MSSDEVSWDHRMYGIYTRPTSYPINSWSNWLDMIHVDDRLNVKQAMETALTTGDSFSVQFKYCHRDGRVSFIESHATIFFNESESTTRVIGINKDITERVSLEQSLTDALFKAQEANKAKSRFLANMSHEIRTPMNGVVGMLELLDRSVLSGQQLLKIKMAKDSANSLITIINDILDFSKVEAGKITLEEVDFNLVDQIEAVINPFSVISQEKSIHLSINYDFDHNLCFNGDPTRIRQIFNNLISNAVKFTRKGSIAIDLKPSQLENNDVKLLFSVTDTGIGIPEDKLDKIFDTFNQADNSTTRNYGGTGLGLAIVKSLCELMGGNIAVQSMPGMGSSFSGELKLKLADENTRISESRNPLNPAMINNATVLLVEDNEINQIVAEELLEELGIECDIAENGAVAIEMLTNKALRKNWHFDVK